jgi:hypothetical protein
MRYFWAPSVTLVLDEPIQIDEDPYSLTHYVRSYYVAARTIVQGLTIIEESARSEQATVLSVEPLEEVPLDRVPRSKGKGINPVQPGVIWRSGRAFFPAN